MTDREKIIEIIAPFISAYGEDEAIADALIEAGIGDVRVTERALLTACANLIKDVEDNIDRELLVHVVYTKILRKAEKELAEEKGE